MDRARKKLIEELIRVGRLIDPAPGTGRRESEDAAKFSDNTEEPDMETPVPESDLEGLPVVDNAVDPPYATKDMFAAPVDSHLPSTATPLEAQQRAANASDSTNLQIHDREEPVAIELEKQLGRDEKPIRFPVEELARDIVNLIEDHVSRRSGEQLDDTFRDELTEAVTAQLEAWLTYD